MNDAYTKLMLQQNLSEEADAAFYEKLENTQPKKRMHHALRAAAIAVCALLLIPVTVLAVENIFGIVITNRIERVTVCNQPGIGLDIRFDNIKSHPITDFSEHLQALDSASVVDYDSWEEAEKDLGIHLLSNNMLTDEATSPIRYNIVNGESRSHCEGIYSCVDGQLFYSKISAAYQRNHVTFVVSAKITAEHPSMTNAQLQEYHGASIAYFQQYDPKVTTEQYTTKNGIPVTICAIDLGSMPEYTAYFAVNDVSYEVRIVGCEGVWEDSAIYAILLEILEGFTLE